MVGGWLDFAHVGNHLVILDWHLFNFICEGMVWVICSIFILLWLLFRLLGNNLLNWLDFVLARRHPDTVVEVKGDIHVVIILLLAIEFWFFLCSNAENIVPNR